MFTGIIEQVGKVVDRHPSNQGQRLIIEAHFEDLQAGESIAVNGVCLTLLPKNKSNLSFDLSPETLERTTLGSLQKGERVNLERALLASTRMGGHYVAGHVDRVACVKSRRDLNDYVEINIGDFLNEEMRYLVPKGSVTLEGVSLTINQLKSNEISLMLIPHTLAHSTLGELQNGQKINIEFDYLARIVVHALTPFSNENP